MGFQKLNKKGMQLKNAFFSIVILSMVIIAVGVSVQDWSDSYNANVPYNLDTYNKLGNISSEAQTQRNSISPQDADPGTGDFEGKVFRGAYGILGKIFTPFEMVFSMLESIEDQFHLPNYIMEGILTLIFFSVIFSIVAILFRLNRSTA